MTPTISKQEKLQALRHLVKASDEMQAALRILYGHFVKPYNPLFNVWKRLNKLADQVADMKTK